MFSDAFRCFPMLSNISRLFSDAFPMPGSSRDIKTNEMLLGGHCFLSDAFPMSFRCLSDVFPMPFRCVSDASDGISDVCSALSDVSNVFLLSLKVRCFSCFECLTVKTCKGRGAMFLLTQARVSFRKKTVGLLRIFAQSWNSFFSA